MFDITGMMGKIKQAQSKLEEVKANLEQITAEGESGAGLVKVYVNGKRKVLQIEMDESLLGPGEKEMLSDLIVAATNKAIEAIEEKISAEIKSATEMLPNIPGVDIGNLFG